MALFETQEIFKPKNSEKFVRVDPKKHVTIFKELLQNQSETLYNHSPIFPFAYLNTGNRTLFLNSDYSPNKIIPLAQKNKTTPTFELFTPFGDMKEILATIDKASICIEAIRDVTKQYAQDFLKHWSGWDLIRTSRDVVQDCHLVTELNGRNFSSIRNTLRRVERDYKPDIKLLTTETCADAILVFKDWQQEQGKKYFRVTIGRDIRLIEEYCKALKDLWQISYFAYVYYVAGKAEAVSFGVRSWSNAEWGIDVTCKANVNIRGLSDFAFQHLITQLHLAGILYVNDSGWNSKGNEINKKKWWGGKEPQLIPMYDLRRKI